MPALVKSPKESLAIRYLDIIDLSLKLAYPYKKWHTWLCKDGKKLHTYHEKAKYVASSNCTVNMHIQVKTYDFGVQTDLIEFLFTGFLVRNQREINVLISP